MLRTKTWDKTTDANIAKLHTLIRVRVRMFICHLEDQGIFLRVYSGYRSPDEQLQIWQKGRDKNGKIVDRKKVVTNAKPFESYHNYGLAIDCVEIRYGKAIWENEKWNEISQVAEFYGFDWGGHFMNTDKPHFQITFGLTWQKLYKLYDSKKMKDGYVIINP